MKHILSSHPLRNSALAAGLAIMVHATGAFGASGVWTSTVSGNWNDSGNWSGGVIAGGSDATADFSTLNITGNPTVHYNLSGTIGNMTFGDTTPSNSWTLDNNGSGANTLTLMTSAGTPTITTNSGSNLISVELLGTQGMTKAGSGTLTLTANNSYTGTTTISTGLLRIGNGGTTGSVAGPIVNSSTLSFNRTDAYTFNNVISGAGGRVVFASTGTTILTAANTYTGINDIQGGATLRGSDSTAYSGDATTKTVFGTGGNVIAVNANSRLELRANGQNNSTGQVLTMTSKSLQYASTTATSMFIDVGREGGTGTNKTIKLAGTLNFATPTTGVTSINFSGADGYLFEANTVTLGNAGSAGTLLLNPTTTSVTIGTVGNSGNAGQTKTLELGGTSAGNVITGAIANAASNAAFTAVNKTGTSTWKLNGVNTYTGSTTVSAGTLLIGDATHTTASLAAGSVVTVGTTGTLGGYGIINGAATINGALNPGASAGKLTFNGGLSLATTAVTTMEISGTSRGVAGGYDAIDLGVASSLAYDGTLKLDITGIIADGTYDLFSFTLVPTGSFSSVVLAGSYAGSLVNNAGVWSGDFGDKTFEFTQASGDLMVTTIPEPGTMTLLALGGAVAMALRKRKRTSL